MECFYVWIAGLVLTGVVGLAKRRAGTALILGFFLGPFALIPLLLLDSQRECPNCASIIMAKAKVCPKCQRDL